MRKVDALFNFFAEKFGKFHPKQYLCTHKSEYVSTYEPRTCSSVG